MRAITGKYKGRYIEVPRSFKARPTTDFAKENLFNVLRAYIDFDEDTVALDLFSGTGSISLELLSRGCGQVISVEKDMQHYRFIHQLFTKKLMDEHLIPLHADAFRYIQTCRMRFDFIFADPPYALEQLTSLPDLIMENELLVPDGLFVLEHGAVQDFSAHPHFLEHRSYGSVNFSIFGSRPSSEE